MNLHQKLLEIRKAVPYLKKDNQGYQYSYVSSSQTLGSVRAKMDEMKVLLMPSVLGKEVIKYESKKEGNLFLTGLDMAFTWVDADNPADVLTFPWYAQGSDNAERGPGKAVTYAEKTFLLKFFNIATDKDDPDAFQERRVEAGKRRKVTGGQPASQGAPPPPEPPMANGQPHPTTVSNPYFGKIINISTPVTGETNGKPWTRWDIETQELDLTCFSTSVAEVAANAIKDNLEVEIIWIRKENKKTGKAGNLAESIRILDADDLRRLKNNALQHN